MRTIQFKNCCLEIEPGFCRTVFFNGKSVDACPQDNDEYRQRALELGYGDDTAAMSLQHEAAHTFLSEKMRLEFSPTLWIVAHSRTDYDRKQVGAEEAMVLAFQRYCRTGKRCSALNALTDRDYDLGQLKEEFLELLYGE